MSDFDFINQFYAKLKEVSPNWYVKGLIDSDHKVYSLGTDSKLIGRIFELKVNSVLKAIADDNDGYTLGKPDVQTEYPDYFFECPDKKRIAVDVKTSYLDEEKNKNRIYYTLGAYKSYLKDNHSGISGGDYKLYKKHYVIGFVYDRVHAEDGNEYTLDDVGKIETPYRNVKVWVQEKYKITGLVEKSGNTANIGSITCGSVDEFKAGNGPFSCMDKSICDDYWRRFTKQGYKTVEDYFKFVRDIGEEPAGLDDEERKYLEWRRKNKPTDEDKLEMADNVKLSIGRTGKKRLLLSIGGEKTKIEDDKNGVKIDRLLNFCTIKKIKVEQK